MNESEYYGIGQLEMAGKIRLKKEEYQRRCDEYMEKFRAAQKKNRKSKSTISLAGVGQTAD